AGVARLDLLGSSALLSRDHRRVPRPDARPHDGQPALRGARDHTRGPLGMTGEIQCRRLPWDSDFFGVSIGIAEVGRISERDLTTIRDWCREQGLACLYLLADPAAAGGLRLLADFGFDRVDERMTLRRDLASAEELPQPGPGVRAAVPEDRAALCEIARTTHHNTRFYKDGRFPRDRCDALYERWISRSLDGEADRVFVAEWQGQPAGDGTSPPVRG